MRLLYQIGIYSYSLIIRIVSLFNSKAKLWVKGRKRWKQRLTEQLDKLDSSKKRIWIHCASLGEFEQGRPVIEALKEKHPNTQIILSFFSPSGYELRKDYQHVDIVYYLPIDTKKNAKNWLSLIKPNMALFVKYEFWPNYLLQLQHQNIPTLFFSSNFRKEQLFFKWYGAWYRSILIGIDFLFVQQQSSIDLLNSIGIHKSAVAGDTRFDRVVNIAEQSKEIAFAQAFSENNFTVVAGSTWPEDETLLKELLDSISSIKLIIAPHEIGKKHIDQLNEQFGDEAICFSKATLQTVTDKRVLIIDNIGMLSSLYRYGQVAYIGGGFGAGIHNTLEAAVYGMPVLFGPKYDKFQEAKDLITANAATSITNSKELTKAVFNFVKSPEVLDKASQNAERFVKENIGATEKVVGWVEKQL